MTKSRTTKIILAAYLFISLGISAYMLLSVTGGKRVSADTHLLPITPLQYRDNHLNRMWAASFPDDNRRHRVRKVLEHDAACYSNTCNNNNTVGSFARWYISESYPHVGLTDNPTRPNYSGLDDNQACGFDDNRITFHIEDMRHLPSDEGENFRTLGKAGPCPHYYTHYRCEDPTVIRPTSSSDDHWLPFEHNCPIGTVPVVTKQEHFLVSARVIFDAGLDGIFWYGDIGENPPSNKADFISVVTHEMGHAYNLGHYVTDAHGFSTDPECDNEQNGDRGRENSFRATMCVPLYRGTRRQVTPELHEKCTFQRHFAQGRNIHSSCN